MKKFCLCGCGGEIYNLKNKYIVGHNTRGKVQSEEHKQKNKEGLIKWWSISKNKEKRREQCEQAFSADKKVKYSEMMVSRWKTDTRRKRLPKFEKFCKCGCGSSVIMKSYHKYMGIPDYLPGHNTDNGFTKRHTKGSKLSKEAYQKRIERVVNGYSNNCKTKWFWSEKNQKELYYHSNYELVSFELLEKMNEVKSYDRCRFAIDYEYEGKRSKYIPDVMITYQSGNQEVVEIKPEYQMKYERNKVKIEAARKFCEENKLLFDVWNENKVFAEC